MDAQKAGLRPDAGDDEICTRANVFAKHYAQLLRSLQAKGLDEDQAGALALESFMKAGMLEHWPQKRQPKMKLRGALGRIKCERFWRRTLRRIHAQTIESCSIDLGLVNKRRDCYVSDLSVTRRRQQRARNAATLDKMELQNELGQAMKVAELAAKSTANPEIRRAELMTRISGLDMIANDMGHLGTFVTVTCPSRMHKWTDTKAGVRPNAKYDGTKPNEAQAYLAKQWAKLRAALIRRGLPVYGFRITEAHHDGCPHWHLLLFYQVDTDKGADSKAMLAALFDKYFRQNDSAAERGALEHRVKFEAIDRARGSAAAYLAKYISKNIDGYKVGEDLYGNPAIESSARVEAWASTWRIRQFQQIGGAPVTVWRELRRLNPENVEGDLMPDMLNKAVSAVNIGAIGGKTAVGYQLYTIAQGGATVKRKDLAIKLIKLESGELNQFDEPKAPETVGVYCHGVKTYMKTDIMSMGNPFMKEKGYQATKPAFAAIESERLQWWAKGSKPHQEIGSLAALARPWTRVNNCTLTEIPIDGKNRMNGVRQALHVQRSKRGRFINWQKIRGAEGQTVESEHHGKNC
jgi:hypothetical protein